MPSPAPPAGDSSISRTNDHQAGHKLPTDSPDAVSPAAGPVSQSPSQLSADEWLQRKQYGNELAASLRRHADREESAPYKAYIYSCINSILIEAARTPHRDRARVLRAMREFGGGVVADIAENAGLPPRDVRQILALLVEERLAYRSREGGLYFLKEDTTAPPRSR